MIDHLKKKKIYKDPSLSRKSLFNREFNNFSKQRYKATKLIIYPAIHSLLPLHISLSFRRNNERLEYSLDLAEEIQG